MFLLGSRVLGLGLVFREVIHGNDSTVSVALLLDRKVQESKAVSLFMAGCPALLLRNS